jgi:hypothetical protein
VERQYINRLLFTDYYHILTQGGEGNLKRSNFNQHSTGSLCNVDISPDKTKLTKFKGILPVRTKTSIDVDDDNDNDDNDENDDDDDNNNNNHRNYNANTFSFIKKLI